MTDVTEQSNHVAGYNRILVERITPAEFDAKMDELGGEYSEALGSSDRYLYELLKLIYRTYLLAHSITQVKEHLNKRVMERLSIREFDVTKQPGNNYFTKLLNAYVKTHDENDRKNSKEYHVPERNSTYAFALHWALRNNWTPDELSDGLSGTGLRQLCELERKARAGVQDRGDLAELEIGDALKALGNSDILELTSIEVKAEADLKSGLNLLLAQVDQNGKSITSLQPIEVPPDDVNRFVKVIAKANSIDLSPAKQLLRTLEIAAHFFDRAGRDNKHITLCATDSKMTVCVALKKDEKTDKQVRFVVSEYAAVPENIPQGVSLGISPADMNDVVSKISGLADVSGWQFQPYADPEHAKKKIKTKVAQLIAKVRVKKRDEKGKVIGVEEDERSWKFLSSDNVSVQAIPNDIVQALSISGISLNYDDWKEQVEALDEARAGRPKSTKLEWLELAVDNNGVGLTVKEMEKKSGSIKVVPFSTNDASVQTSLKAFNLPEKILKFMDLARINQMCVAPYGAFWVLRCQSRGVQYAIGFERCEYVPKA